MVNAYIWQSRKARCAFSRLATTRKAGGVGLVTLKDFYTSSILAQLKTWFPQANSTRWKELERNQTQGNHLYHFLLASQHSSLQTTSLSPTIMASFQAWKLLLTTPFQNSTTTLLTLPLLSLSIIIPNLNVTRWVEKGIKGIDDPLIGTCPKTFSSLQIEYGLSNLDYYTYLQINHFICSNLNTAITLPWKVTLYYTKPHTKTKGISLFYNLLNRKDVFTKTSHIQAWKKDLSTKFSSEKWQTALRITYAATRSVNLRELTPKMLFRWYLMPYRIAKFSPHTPSTCWRNCEAVGTRHHKLWSCPAIATFFGQWYFDCLYKLWRK